MKRMDESYELEHFRIVTISRTETIAGQIMQVTLFSIFFYCNNTMDLGKFSLKILIN